MLFLGLPLTFLKFVFHVLSSEGCKLTYSMGFVLDMPENSLLLMQFFVDNIALKLFQKSVFFSLEN